MNMALFASHKKIEDGNVENYMFLMVLSLQFDDCNYEYFRMNMIEYTCTIYMKLNWHKDTPNKIIAQMLGCCITVYATYDSFYICTYRVGLIVMLRCKKTQLQTRNYGPWKKKIKHLYCL